MENHPLAQNVVKAFLGVIAIINRVLRIEHDEERDFLPRRRYLSSHFVRQHTVDAQTRQGIRPLGLNLPHLSNKRTRDLFQGTTPRKLACLSLRQVESERRLI